MSDCINLYTALYVYTLIRLYVYTLIRLYVYTLIRLYAYTFICLYVYTLIHLYAYTFIRLYVSADVWMTQRNPNFRTAWLFDFRASCLSYPLRRGNISVIDRLTPANCFPFRQSPNLCPSDIQRGFLARLSGVSMQGISIFHVVSFPATEGKDVVFPALKGESNDVSMIWSGDLWSPSLEGVTEVFHFLETIWLLYRN